MKRILLLLLILALVSPVSAAVSPVKANFQEYVPMTAPFYVVQEDFTFFNNGCGVGNIAAPDTYGNVLYQVNGGGGCNPYMGYWSSLFTYTSYTASGNHAIYIANSLGKTKTFLMSYGAGRYEIVASGTTLHVYVNDVEQTTDSGWDANPNHIEFYQGITGAGQQTFDNVVIGYYEDSTVVGTIPPNYYIYYDGSSPASTGLYEYNVTGPINSNYFGVSYGRAVSDATTLQLIDPDGTVVKTYAITNWTVNGYLPINDLKVSGAIKNGLWHVGLGDSAERAEFWVMAYGASIAWDKTAYTNDELANVTWAITDSAWNITSPGEHYFFHLKIQDVYGTVKHDEFLNTQSGTYSFTFDSTNYDEGVYYAIVTRVNSLPPVETMILNYDDTELLGIARLYGYINNAETGVPIANSRIVLTQGTVSEDILTSTGYYNTSSATIFGSGSAINMNVTATGYRQYTYGLTPLEGRSILRNVSMIPSPPTYSGIGLMGIVSESQYERPIPNPYVQIVNTTYGDSYSLSANAQGYYMLDQSDGAELVNGRCYNVTAWKARYSTESTLKCIQV